MLFKYIEITFRYFDLLFRYLTVRSLKPIFYIVIFSVLAAGLFGSIFIFAGIEEYFKEFWNRTRDPANDIFYGISLLILARILYFLMNWFEGLIDLENLSREHTSSFLRLDLGLVNTRVEKLKEFDHLRRMDIGYFQPKFWFINEKTFLKDLKEFKRLVDHYRNKKLKFDETHYEIADFLYDFLSGNVKDFKSRYASYYDSTYKFHWTKNYLDEEIEDYIYQIKGSIEWDEYELSEDKRKTSLKKRILNQKKLIELINDDPRQFIIEYIYRYYYEKHRYHPKRLEALRAVDRKINYKLDSKTSIEIRTNFIEPIMESFTYEYHHIFDEE